MHPARFRLDAGQRILGGLREDGTVLARELRVSVDGRQRRAQFVAGVGDELAHPPIRRRDVRERAFHVVEQPVQRVTDEPHLSARIGVADGHARLIVWWSRSSGSVATSAAVAATRSSGRSAKRTIAIVHSGGNQQCQRRHARHDHGLTSHRLPCRLARGPCDKQLVTVAGPGHHPVVPQVWQVDGAWFGSGPGQFGDLRDGVRSGAGRASPSTK